MEFFWVESQNPFKKVDTLGGSKHPASRALFFADKLSRREVREVKRGSARRVGSKLNLCLSKTGF